MSEIFTFFLTETKNIVFFELILKESKSFFKSLFFNRSDTYSISLLVKCFSNGFILNFSSTNRMRFEETFGKLLFL